jgi:hypothetical protein
MVWIEWKGIVIIPILQKQKVQGKTKKGEKLLKI